MFFRCHDNCLLLYNRYHTGLFADRMVIFGINLSNVSQMSLYKRSFIALTSSFVSAKIFEKSITTTLICYFGIVIQR